MNNLESVNCNFCGSNNNRIVYVKEGFNIVKCNNCNLVFVNPRLTDDAINKLYDNNYFVGNGFDQSIKYDKEFIEKKDLVDLSDWDLSALVEMSNYKPGLKLLDIGSGMGLFLYKAKKKNFEVKGLELSEYAVSFSKSKGLDTENNSIYRANLPKNYYNVISMKEVIEHLPDPKKALSIIYDSLAPKGVLFITTGNYNCPERMLRGSNWFYFMPKGHIYIFQPNTIKKYLTAAGFSKVVVTNQGDLLMNFLLKLNIIDTERFIPNGIFKKLVFYLIRFINHFISSGMRIYAIK
ncbi:MAG TPA: class I SAM-dependent methyltransferase [Melioribacteraceae bacterium]|nr:class I SAM-dependent methyltransferase [Melioribacteraceae bacterium]